MSYKDFMADLPDDVTPAAAQQLYEDYRVRFYGSRRRVYWEEHKNDDELRDKYDPSRLKISCESRNEEARSTALDFFRTKLEGSMAGPAVEGEMAMDMGGDADGQPPETTPYPIASTPERMERDTELAWLLISKLDEEKGIVDNQLSATQLQLEATARLDLYLDYLWSIHGVDYYGSKELFSYEYSARKVQKRTVRAPLASVASEATAPSPEEEVWMQKLEEFWRSRADGSRIGPTEARLQTERIEKELETFVESQIIKIEEGKYGCKLSQKLFIGPEFVKKHVRVKHAGVVDEFQAKLLDDIYRENYLEDAPDTVPEQPVFPLHAHPGMHPLGGPLMMPPAGFPAPGIAPMSQQAPVGIPALDRARQRYVDLDTNVVDRPVLDYGDL